MEGLGIDVHNFAQAIAFWGTETQARLKRAHKWAGQLWVAEAKKRCPVDEGRLRSSIRTNTYSDSYGILITEVGTNVEYGVYVEFGTKWIANGAVLRIGLRPDVNDAQSIHWWRAKAGDAFDVDDVSIAHRGGKLVTLGGGEAAGPQEQMPWLRSAWSVCRPKVIQWFSDAMQPPAQSA